ncbi:MAG: ATP-binding protein [Inquilinaceae bacterium]
MAIRHWLTAIGLGAMVERFEQNDIDLDILPDLTEQDLDRLGLSLGQRKRFLRAVEALGAPDPAGLGLSPERAPAERRHLTVMFCDMVGSTALSEALEAEDLLEVIRRYQVFCASIIGRCEGYIARYVGDGILAYFGYPMASEGAAENAVLAGLDITAGIGDLDLPDSRRLSVRIGIASGVVIVGDLIGAGSAMEQPAIGVAPNLAARLMSIAPPDHVVVAESTRRLTADAFDYRTLGQQTFRGLSEPVEAWRLIGARADPRATVSTDGVAPFIGRVKARDLLRGQWRDIVNGSGRAMLISGEPGIGKSRLVEQFLHEIEDETATVQVYQASPHAQDSPLYPVSQRLRLLAGIKRGDDEPTIRRKLEPILIGQDTAARQERLDIFVRLVSPSSATPDDGLAQARRVRQQTMNAVIGHMIALAEMNPVVALIEDVQWLDPTSRELLPRVLSAITRHRVLVIVTSREAFDPDWRALSHVTSIDLDRLSRDDSKALVTGLAAARPLSPALIEEILDKTDGIPLFVEELTRNLLEVGDRDKSTDDAPSTGRIPDSLQDSLMERLDRVGPAKAVARIGAVFGRSFTRALVRKTGDLDDDRLSQALDTLTAADLVRREIDQQGTERFVFKHALVQETAYASLLREERQRLHAAAMRVLREQLPAIEDDVPELLARHATEANLPREAAGLWLQAGRRSLAQSAVVEAVHHLRRGLEAVDRLTDDQDTRQLRLQLLIRLGPALIAMNGPGSAEVEAVYAQGYALCRRLPESIDHFPVYWGWWRLSRDFGEMGRRADELLNRARQRGDEEMLLQAHHCQWASHFNRGDLQGCLDHIEQGLGLYDHGDYTAHAALYGNHDARVCGHGERALVHWLMGLPEKAMIAERDAHGWLQVLDHLGSRMHLLDISLMHRLYRRDAGEVGRLADEMIEMADNHGFSDHRAKALIFRGWAKSRLGDRKGGLAELRQGLSRQQEIGTQEDFPVYFDMFAETLALNGLIEEALEEMARAMREFQSIELAIWMPELHRRQARLLEEAYPGNPEPAMAAYHRAIAVAGEQGAEMLTRRATADLSRLGARTGLSIFADPHTGIAPAIGKR